MAMDKDIASGSPSAHGTLTRRRFFAAGVVSAVTIGSGVAIGTTGQSRPAYLHPPGFFSEKDFAGRCIKCQLCVQACHASVVEPLSLQQSVAGIGTPVINFKNGYCDFCMDCVEVCPTGALRQGSPTDERIGVAKVIKDACVAWGWTGCSVCADVCPVEGALVLDDLGQPVVDESLCNGCGLCENACPAASLRAYDSTKPDKGIYVVAPDSAAAQVPGPLVTEQFVDLRFRRKEGKDA